MNSLKRMIIIIGVGLISAFYLISLFQHFQELNQKKEELNNLKKEYKEQDERINTLMEKDNKEKYFKEQYKLSEEGDILFDFPEE